MPSFEGERTELETLQLELATALIDDRVTATDPNAEPEDRTRTLGRLAEATTSTRFFRIIGEGIALDAARQDAVWVLRGAFDSIAGITNEQR